MTAALLVVIAILVLLACCIVIGIARGWFRSRGSATAFLTAFHDLQPRDKQEAIEAVMEQKAGRRLGTDLSGEGGIAPDAARGDEKEQNQ